jgi:uncharacterized protein YukE
MFPTKRPSTLASFAYPWVGGDIHGLSAFAGTLYGYLAPIDDIITAVNAKVSNVVAGGGWSGAAATAFTNAWQADTRGAAGLGAAIEVIGDTVDSLAVRLADLEHELETAADQATAAGATVNPDGSPGAVMPLPASGAVNVVHVSVAAQAASISYGALWQRVMNDARQARLNAATTLENLYQQLAPGGTSGSGSAGATSAMAGIADQLRGFWTVPTTSRWLVTRDATLLAGQATEARSTWLAAGGAAAEFGNASWVTTAGTGATLASAGSVAGAVASMVAAGQAGQPWYQGISDESLASVTDATMGADVGGAAASTGALSFVSSPMAGALVGAAATGVLAAGIGRAIGSMVESDEGAGKSVGGNANRLWNRVIEPRR